MRPELLLPAGSDLCLRAAVENGADAVYLGLKQFNARTNAENFSDLPSVVNYAHKNDVKVYVTLNTLVKNSELIEFLDAVNTAEQSKADAIIIQDPAFIPLIKKHFKIPIHLSTQSTITNTASLPKGIERVILPRETSFEQIKRFTDTIDTEIFIHGALCFSYSGQCLMSAMGGRSGNRGCCAQPCRRKYNNKYLLSTKDLCLLDQISKLLKVGVKSFKVEGRMRSALYVGTAARVYRKVIDGKIITAKDRENLMLAFNREFTEGFMFEKSIVDNRNPMNRGLYLGKTKNNRLQLRYDLKIGDGISLWLDNVVGTTVKELIIDNQMQDHAGVGKVIELKAPDNTPVYKTSSVDLNVELAPPIETLKFHKSTKKIALDFQKKENSDTPKIFAKAYSQKQALEITADVVYYNVYADDFLDLKHKIKTKLFCYTPRIIDDDELSNIVKLVNKLKPDGVLVGNPGLIPYLKQYEIHLDYSFNIYNDQDLLYYKGLPVISPELNLKELDQFRDKNFSVLVHGDLVVMTTKEPLKAPELVDEEGRHFKVRKSGDINEILNEKPVGLFNEIHKLIGCGIKYFYIDSKDAKWPRIYKKIIEGSFDDQKIKKGHTLVHFYRGIS